MFAYPLLFSLPLGQGNDPDPNGFFNGEQTLV